MKRLLLATLCCALAAGTPVAEARPDLVIDVLTDLDPSDGCVLVAVGQPRSSSSPVIYEGVVAVTVIDPVLGTVGRATCHVEVNGVQVGPTAIGIGVGNVRVGMATTRFATTDSSSVVTSCNSVSCQGTTANQVPPQEVNDLVGDLLDPILCPIIGRDIIVFVGSTYVVWNCPPY